MRILRRSTTPAVVSVTALTALALLASIPRATYAGVNVWTTNGPEGGYIGALAIDPTSPSTLYAGTSGGGVFKSTNSGTSWSAVNSGLTNTNVRALAIDPTTPSTLYAGTSAGGVFAITPLPIPVEPCIAAPVAGCLYAAQALLSSSEETPGKERLKLQWKRVTSATTQGMFGDPTTGTTRVALCLYGDGGTLLQGFVVDQGGQFCAGKPCWSAKGTNGYAYKDKTAAADGISKIGYGAGDAGKGRASAAGANNASKGQAALPTGVVAALSGNTSPTIQLVTSDGFCLGATMTEVMRDDGLHYRARKK